MGIVAEPIYFNLYKVVSKYLFTQLPWELLCSINDRTRNINSRLRFLLNLIYRSDAQRSNKQKERKKQELERQVYNADHFAEEAGFPTSLVSVLQPFGTDESHLTILLRMKTQPFKQENALAQNLNKSF